jgi:formylglycine-generating enzyme required for sulfatase activity/tetratricopeptide (TPR) repeat protein
MDQLLDARIACDRCISTHPNDPQVTRLANDLKNKELMVLADAAFDKSDLETAESKAKEALALKPDDGRAADMIAKVRLIRYREILQSAKDDLATNIELAEKEAKTILADYPDDADAKKIIDEINAQRRTSQIQDAQRLAESDPDGAIQILRTILEIQPDDPDANDMLAKIASRQYLIAIDKAESNIKTDPDAAIRFAITALKFKPGDPTAKQMLVTLSAGRTVKDKLSAITQAEIDFAQGLTSKSAQEYRALIAAYPSDVDLTEKAAEVVFASGEILAAADMACVARDASTTEADRLRFDSLLQHWRRQFEPLNAQRLTAGIAQIKAGQISTAGNQVAQACRLLSDVRVGLPSAWLVQIAAGNEHSAVESLKSWINAHGRKVDDVAISPICQAFPDIVHRAVTDAECAKWLVDAFGADGPKLIEAKANALTQGTTEDSTSNNSGADPTDAGIAGGQVRKNVRTGLDMIWIPRGSSPMGDDIVPDKTSQTLPVTPKRSVLLSGFWVSKTPVTVGEFKTYCLATGLDFGIFTPPQWGWIDEDPMVNVTWQQARLYCKWADGDLPNELQWEKAARGADSRKYPWGNQWDSNRLQFNAVGTSRVDAHPSGASPYGCLDMAGNVWQWCLDRYTDFPAGSESQKVVASRMVRGGGWDVKLPINVRAETHTFAAEATGKDDIGFRLVIQK